MKTKINKNKDGSFKSILIKGDKIKVLRSDTHSGVLKKIKEAIFKL